MDKLEFKIVDFGLATEVCNKLMKKCGTPGYMAPEVFNETGYDFKVDIFSSGILLYIM